MLEILSWGEVSGEPQARVAKVRGDGRGQIDHACIVLVCTYIYTKENTHRAKKN